MCEGGGLRRDSGLSGPRMIFRVSLLAQALTLLLLTPGAYMQVIKNCRDLRATVERAASRGHGTVADLTLELPGHLQYHCEESIRIAPSQYVKLVGDDGLAVNVYVALKPGSFTEMPSPGASSAWGIEDDGRDEEGLTKSLFVNEGTLSLENISFHLNSAQGDMYEVPAGEGKRTRRKDRCIGTARLVRNSGHLIMQNSSVVDTLPSVYSGGRPLPNCRRNESAQQGRVVYSDGNNRSTVMVSRSNFNLTFHGEVGEGSAFYTKAGTVVIERSWFGTKASHPRETTSRETADLGSSAAVVLTVSVSEGCSVEADAAFTGHGIGVTGHGDGVVVFEERKGIRGEYLFVKADCSFLRRETNLDDDNASLLRSSSGVDVPSADLRPRAHRQLLTMHTDRVWLLVVVAAALITVMGLCCLSIRWRRHPVERRRWWCCRARDRRVQHDDHHADGMAAARATGVAGEDLTEGGVKRNSLTQSYHLHVDLYSMCHPGYDTESSFVLPQNLKNLLAKPQANVRSATEGPGLIAAADAADTADPDAAANDNGSKLAETTTASSSGGDETPVDEGEPGLPPFAVDRGDVSDVRVPRNTTVRDNVFDGGLEDFSDDSLVEDETGTVPTGKTFTPARIYRSGSRELPTSPLQVQPALPIFSCSTSPGEGATVPADRRCQLDTLLCDGERQVQAAGGNTDSGVAADGPDARSSSPRTASSRSRSRGDAGPVDLALAEAASSTRWTHQMGKEPDDDMCYSPDNEIDGGFFAIVGNQTSNPVLVSSPSPHGEKPDHLAVALAAAVTSEVPHDSPVPLLRSAEVGPNSGNSGDVLCYSASSTESGTGSDSFSSAGSPVFVSSAEEHAAGAVRKMASTKTNEGHRAAASPLSRSGGIGPGFGDHDGGFCYSTSSSGSGKNHDCFSSAGSPVFVSAAEEYAAEAAAVAAAGGARKMASSKTNEGHRAAASPLSSSAGISPGVGGHEDEMCYSASSTESGPAGGGFSSRGSPVAVSAVEGHAALVARKGADTISSISSRHHRTRDHIPQDAQVV